MQRTLNRGNIVLLLEDGFLVKAIGKGPWAGYVAYPYAGYTVSTALSDWIETPEGLRNRNAHEGAARFASEVEETIEALWDELYELAETACCAESGFGGW